MLSNHLILCCPLLLLPPIFPSIRVSSNELAVPIRWPKYWNFSVSLNEYSRLISIRIDWFVLLSVQGILKSLQYHSLKASVLQCSAFFMLQFSHPYMTNGKTIALTRQTFVSKVMFLLLGLSCFYSKEQVMLFSHHSATLWTVAFQASPSMGFSRQEYWSGLPFPSPVDLPNPGIESWSPALQADFLPSEPLGK